MCQVGAACEMIGERRVYVCSTIMMSCKLQHLVVVYCNMHVEGLDIHMGENNISERDFRFFF